MKYHKIQLFAVLTTCSCNEIKRFLCGICYNEEKCDVNNICTMHNIIIINS